MLRFLHVVSCFTLIMVLCGKGVPAVAGEAPKPSEAEVKAMAKKLVGKFRLLSEVQNEDLRNWREIDSLLGSSEKDKAKITEAAIRALETQLKTASIFGIDDLMLEQHHNLGLLYASVGKNEKACEHWQKALDIGKKTDRNAGLADLMTQASCNQNAIPQWKQHVQIHLERNKHPSSAAQTERKTGTVTVLFVMDRNGKLLSSRVKHSSGHTDLDREALELVVRSQPFPTPPSELPDAKIKLILPVRFM
jgi:TonB family protein